MEVNDKAEGIWLEVAEVQFESGKEGGCLVLLKADREQPKPNWWPVALNAIKKDNDPFDDYKEILNQIDKKRAVLARLSWVADKNGLRCNAFRFQSPELGSR
jgi:hypothetical protein